MKYIKRYNEDIDWDWDEEDTPPIPEDFKGYEEFYNFLVKNDILDKWIYNIKKYHFDFGNDTIDINKFLSSEPNKHFINYAFGWTETPEGYSYWDRYNDILKGYK